MMGFINEFISAEDIIKFDIHAVNFRYLKSNRNPNWTIDRERNIYLRRMTTGREEFAADSEWTLYWKGTLIPVDLTVSGEKLPDDEDLAHYKLRNIVVPDDLRDKRSEILGDLKDALSVFAGGGVYAGHPVAKTTFNF